LKRLEGRGWVAAPRMLPGSKQGGQGRAGEELNWGAVHASLI
jgi:hypothetical protein